MENLHKVDLKKLKKGDFSDMEQMASMMDLINDDSDEKLFDDENE